MQKGTLLLVFLVLGNRINLGVGRIQQSGAGGDDDEAY